MATPTAPIPQSPDWKDVLEFVRKQGAEDRAYFDHIFKRTTWGVSLILGVGLAVARFLGWRSLADAREQVRSQTQAEISNMRAEVRKRIDAEFQTPEITKIVQTVARERASQEINRIISEAVARQVQTVVKSQEDGIRKAITQDTQAAVARLAPTIDDVVAKQIRTKVESAINPLEDQLAKDREVLMIGAIANAAMNGSRAAYFKLKPALASQNPRVQEIAIWATLALDDEQFAMLKSGILNPDLTPEVLLQMASTGPATIRAKVAAGMGQSKDRRYIPRIVEMVRSDPDLRVLRAALNAFSALTGSNFKGEEDGMKKAEEWWSQHKAEFK
jgi:hypothetical protein